MLPEGWKNTRVDEISSLVTSGARNWAQYYSESGSLFIRMMNLMRDSIGLNFDSVQYVDVQNVSEAKRTKVEVGDILLSITAELGKVSFVNQLDGDAYISQHVAIIRIDNDKADPCYLAYVISSKEFNKKLQKLNDAGAKAGLNLPTIRALSFNLPPLAEQKKIAEILSTWDEAISVVDRQLENCRQQKKALMQKLLTGKKRLPGFSGEWSERKISEIASVNPENLANSTRNDYRFSYISLDDVTEGNLTGVTQQTFASSPSRARRIIQQGDVLVAMVRPNLKSHLLIRDKVEDFICSTGFCVIRPHEGVLSQYIYHQFFGDIVNAQIEGLITGSNYPAINSYDVENIMIPLPGDIREQKVIVNVLEGYESSLKKLEAKRNLLALEKKSLMQQLLTGKKRVAV